ncbi:hypothetical protein SLEP1_g23332 [Rubroshorea leprosula]|uniref:Uncharacterized protein n=1 Tax=Rubroshorea leprosula TaxID=152421 RepID=A0AAV5JC07_9ROSI|nr:hypothetical protein SLEP1_g23332 [Rubroshorea leprosula]
MLCMLRNIRNLSSSITCNKDGGWPPTAVSSLVTYVRWLIMCKHEIEKTTAELMPVFFSAHASSPPPPDSPTYCHQIIRLKISTVWRPQKNTHHIAMSLLIAEDYKRRVKNSRKEKDGAEREEGPVGLVSFVSVLAGRIRARIGHQTVEVVERWLEPKSQIAVAACNGFFSARIFFLCF